MKKNLYSRHYKIYLVILFLVMTLSLVVGLSYAYWNLNYKQQNSNVASTSCFSLSFTDNTEGIFLTDIAPTKDEEGLKEKGYSFTIKNTCNTIATYEVNLEDILASSDTKQLPNKYIKVSLNDGTPKVLNTYEEVKPTIEDATNSFKLTSGSLRPDEEATYELKLWMDSETPVVDEVMSATFESKITVNTSYIEEENLANDITIASVTQEKSYSNTKETVTFEVTGTDKNIIEYSFNNKNWTSVTPSKRLTFSYDFTEEKMYTLYIKDEVGNIKDYSFSPTWLDKSAPVSTLEVQNENGIYTLKINMTDEKSGVDSYQITTDSKMPDSWLKYNQMVTQTISPTATYYIWSKDKAGNITYEAYSLNQVDKTPPTILVESTLKDWGNSDTIKIHLTDDLIGISGYQVTREEKEPSDFILLENTLSTDITYEVNENGTYYIYAKDAFNHISHIEIEINKIDDIAPILEKIVNSSSGNWAKSVTLSWKAVDNETGIQKYQMSFDKETWSDLASSQNTMTFDEDSNKTLYLRVIDNNNNVSNIESTVIKIDTTSPVISNVTNPYDNIWTNEKTFVSLTGIDESSGIDHYERLLDNSWVSEGIDIVDNKGVITFAENMNETVSFRAVDKVGNISNEVTTTVKIDKDKPNQSFHLSSSTLGENNWYQSLSLNVSVSDDASGLLNSYYCFTTLESCEPDVNATISNGGYNVTFKTNEKPQKMCVNTLDNAGNNNLECTDFYKVDTANPTGALNAKLTENNISLTVTADDLGSKIDSYYYSKDGGKTYLSLTNSSYTFASLEDGSYNLSVKVKDKAGRFSNVMSQTVVVAYQNTYVSSSGNDTSGNGSKNSPYETISRAYQQVKNGGNINVLSDITQSNQKLSIASKTVNLLSSGGTYTIKRGNTNSLLELTNTSMNLSNIVIDGASLSSSNPLILLNGSMTFNINSGAILKGTSGSGATVKDNSGNVSVNVNGGEVYSNSSNCLIGLGTYTVNSGIVSNEESTVDGYPTIYLWTGTRVHIKGGTLKASSSPVIYADGGTVTIDGGTLSGKNTIYMRDYDSASSLTITDGTITGTDAYTIATSKKNTTINISGGTFKMTDKEGGILIRNNSGTVTITGGNFESSSTVLLNYNTTTINGGTFTQNATENYNSIRNYSGTINITNGTYKFNKPIGVDSGAILNISGGTIESGTSNSIINSGTLNLSGTAIIQNNASSYPTIYNYKSSTFTNNLTTGYVKNLGGGSGIYTAKS